MKGKIMGRFHDTLDSWRDQESGTVELPEDWEQQVGTAYDDDFTEAGDLSTSKIAELTTANEALAAQLQAAKAHNYDLLMNGPVDGGGSDSDPDNSENDEPDSSGDPIDDLFH